MKRQPSEVTHLKPLFGLFIFLQILFFAPRLNSDGAYYYEYLRSWVLQNDLNFHDEREFFTWEWVPVLKDFLPGDWEETGYPPNIFSFGPALVWMPFFLIGHLLIICLNGLGADISMTGYGALHRFLPMLASALAGLITLVILDRIGRTAGFEPEERSEGLFFILGASHLPAFLFVTPAFAHSFSVLFTSVFVLIWYHSGRNTFLPHQAALFGIVAGMAVTTRWQNLFILILPLMDVISDLVSKPNRVKLKNMLIRWAAFGTTFLFTLLPQLLVTRTLYGKWITDPQGEGGMRWFSPMFRYVLFDGVKGLFTVNPVLLPALVGLPFLWKRNKRLTWGLVLLIISQSYINAVRRDWAGVGFGMRRFLNLMPGFALGMMVLFAAVRPVSRRWIRNTMIAFGSIMIAWNLLLMTQYYLSPLGAPWIEMRSAEMIRAQFLLAPSLLAELVSSGLVIGGFAGDYAGLVLGIIAVSISVLLMISMPFFVSSMRKIWSRPNGRYLTVPAAGWIGLLIWLSLSLFSTRTFHFINVSGPGQSVPTQRYQLNPEKGIQGQAGGLEFKYNRGWKSIVYKPEYDKNRFLSPGRMILQTPSLQEDSNRVVWTLDMSVDAQAVEIVSALKLFDTIHPHDVIGILAVTDVNGDVIRFPVEYLRHAGCSPDVPPKRGSLIPRRWPALAPIECDQTDTRARFDLPGNRLIQSVSIDFMNLPVKWFIRGIALVSPDERDWFRVEKKAS